MAITIKLLDRGQVAGSVEFEVDDMDSCEGRVKSVSHRDKGVARKIEVALGPGNAEDPDRSVRVAGGHLPDEPGLFLDGVYGALTRLGIKYRGPLCNIQVPEDQDDVQW